MANNAAETVIGAVVLAVAGGFLAYAATTADVGPGRGTYALTASFRKAEGVNVGGDVRIAGVKIGSISAMALDPKTYRATLTLAIDPAIKLPDDTSVKIASASLLGDSYIALDPGASEFMLAPGAELTITQDSISMTDMLGRFVQGSADK